MKWDEFMDYIGRRLALLTKVVKLTVTVAACPGLPSDRDAKTLRLARM